MLGRGYMKVVPTKPRKTGNELRDLWFLSQWELKCHKQPSVIAQRDFELMLNAVRERAPTTQEEIQTKLDNRHRNRNDLDSVDYSDDEDEDFIANVSK